MGVKVPEAYAQIEYTYLHLQQKKTQKFDLHYLGFVRNGCIIQGKIKQLLLAAHVSCVVCLSVIAVYRVFSRYPRLQTKYNHYPQNQNSGSLVFGLRAAIKINYSNILISFNPVH